MDEKVTRRLMGLILGGLGAATASAQTKMSATIIHQDVDFKTTPARIYAVLLDAKEFAAFTKDKAEIQSQAGAPFKLFGGRIEGRNVELVPNQRIVQAWRSAGWPSGVYSIVRFELTARGDGARIAFDHTGFPEGAGEHLAEGWVSNYWEPLHKYLNG